MAFVVSSLTDYVDQMSKELIQASHFEAKTASLIPNIQSGIKASQAIQLLGVNAFPQADTACGFVASGSTTFTQRNIVVGAIKYQDTLCPKTLRSKWTQTLLRPGSGDAESDLTFEADIAKGIVDLVNEQNENRLWQGNTLSTDPLLTAHEGLIKLIDAGSPVDGNTGSLTTWTSANAVAGMLAMVDALPAKLKGKSDLAIFCGTDFFDVYVTALLNKNWFHHDAATGNYEIKVPGKNVMIYGVHGLDGTNRMFGMRRENMYLGVDIQGEEERFDMWYSKDDRNVKYDVAYKMGVQVAYTEECVEFSF
tara:strand:+ start:1340 stop:2263 length:924 start_codon:yes stop_codon:yes gene_type:complete